LEIPCWLLDIDPSPFASEPLSLCVENRPDKIARIQ